MRIILLLYEIGYSYKAIPLVYLALKLESVIHTELHFMYTQVGVFFFPYIGYILSQ